MTGQSSTRSLVTAEGRTVSWAECGAGDGTPVLWFHGAPASRLDASPDGPYADVYTAAGIRLVAIDRPGYGRTDPAPAPALSDTVRDVVLVADTLELPEFAVLGYSAGGPPALVTAAHLGSRVSAVGVLAGIAPPSLADHGDLGERDLFEMALHAPADLRTLVASLGQGLRNDTIATAMDLLAGSMTEEDQAALGDPGLASLLVATLAESARQDLVGYVIDIETLLVDWAPELSKVTQPVLITHGSSDRVVPARHGRALASALPTATYDEVAGGHLSVLTALPRITAELVNAGTRQP